MRSTAGPLLRRHFTRAVAVLQARRAARRLFCNYCGRDLFTIPTTADRYCSDECADRELTRREFTLQIY
ncbi:MAG: hypothetical protein EOP16_02035 [Pseudonocardia sp.]|nr:MAG: hypothetical protein EOP16_02035 [Pseudonocardia sp.]